MYVGPLCTIWLHYRKIMPNDNILFHTDLVCFLSGVCGSFITNLIYKCITWSYGHMITWFFSWTCQHLVFNNIPNLASATFCATATIMSTCEVNLFSTDLAITVERGAGGPTIRRNHYIIIINISPVACWHTCSKYP